MLKISLLLENNTNFTRTQYFLGLRMRNFQSMFLYEVKHSKTFKPALVYLQVNKKLGLSMKQEGGLF